ncbi:hypothetical protein Q5687_17785, partial [Microcoleus sp. AT10_D2]|uniref:hypothetical protein n=1 Tax=Microcoleus sp. AT10_D2 TaxID=3055286 RepID=UPI002FD05B55
IRPIESILSIAQPEISPIVRSRLRLGLIISGIVGAGSPTIIVNNPQSPKPAPPNGKSIYTFG